MKRQMPKSYVRQHISIRWYRGTWPARPLDLPDDPNRATHGHPLQGHSLRPLLDDPEAGRWSGPPVALTSVRGDTGIHHSVRSQRYRYTLCQNGEEELYDHQTDPHEWHNRASDTALCDVRAELRAEMMELLWKDT